ASRTLPRRRPATRRGRARQRSRSHAEEVSRSASLPPHWCQVAKDEAIALDDLSSLAGDRLDKDRPRMDKRVELAVFAAGIDAGRQLCDQPFVVGSPGEGGVEPARIDADERRLEARVEKLSRKRGGVLSPEWEEPALAGRGEPLLAVGANVLEEQVAERNSLDTGQGWGCEGFGHPRLVDLVDAGRRDY